MRILVYPHSLAIGGSQINAIDLAAKAANDGHDVIVYGIVGPLVPYIEKLGLRFYPARRLRYRPAPSRIAQLMKIARKEKLDLIHAYEWPPCLDAYYGAGLMMGLPVVCTVLSMSVMPCIPSSIPLIMGTRELGEQAKQSHLGPVWVIEPPIDVDNDHPGIDGSELRSRWRIAAEEVAVVTVSRLSLDLKLDALVRAMDAVDLLADRYPIRLVLVGDGPARPALEQRARKINKLRGREVVTLHGSELDPRRAYAAADLIVGMGSSALRAMAIGKPVIVQGEDAFSETFDPATLDLFLRQGFYGLGNAEPGSYRLADQLEDLLRDPQRRNELAHYGREVVCSRFSIHRAASIQEEIYESVMLNRPKYRLREVFTSAGRALNLEIENHNPVRQRAERIRESELLRAAAGCSAWPVKHSP